MSVVVGIRVFVAVFVGVFIAVLVAVLVIGGVGKGDNASHPTRLLMHKRITNGINNLNRSSGIFFTSHPSFIMFFLTVQAPNKVVRHYLMVQQLVNLCDLGLESIVIVNTMTYPLIYINGGSPSWFL